MTPPAGTIDLGQLPRDWWPEPDASWPALVRLRRWHTPRRTGRLAGTVVATGLALLVVTGAAAPTRPAFVPQFTVPAVYGSTYDEQSLYTLEQPGPGRSRVTAYRLADGAVRWQVPAPGGESAWLQRWEGGLLLHSSLGPASTIMALDPDTGQQLWQRRLDSQDLLSPVGDGHMLLGNFSADPDWPASESPPIELSAIDPATGQTAWSVSTTGTWYSHDYPDSPYLVVYHDDGDIRSYRLSTGEQLAHRSVDRADYHDVHLVGSLVLLTNFLPAMPEVTAYDAATLTPRWTFTGLDSGLVWPDQCGELLCLVGGQSPRALDPATGELVWSADWLPPPDGDEVPLMVSGLAGERLAGYLLLTENTARSGWLVDAGTGVPVLDLHDWRVSQRWPPTGTDPEPRLVRDTGAGALVGELSADLSGVRLLGEVEAPPGSSCRATARYAMCWDLSTAEGPPRELTVWRYRLA